MRIGFLTFGSIVLSLFLPAPGAHADCMASPHCEQVKMKIESCTPYQPEQNSSLMNAANQLRTSFKTPEFGEKKAVELIQSYQGFLMSGVVQSSGTKACTDLASNKKLQKMWNLSREGSKPEFFFATADAAFCKDAKPRSIAEFYTESPCCDGDPSVPCLLLGTPSGRFTAVEEKVPADVKELKDRVDLCIHWAGESGEGNPQRAAEINRAIKDLRCEQLSPDAIKLKKKYAKNNSATKVLEDAKEQWRAGMGETLF